MLFGGPGALAGGPGPAAFGSFAGGGEVQPPLVPEDRECIRGALSVDQAFRCLNRAVLGTHRAKSRDLAPQHRLNLFGDLDAAGLVAVIGMY